MDTTGSTTSSTTSTSHTMTVSPPINVSAAMPTQNGTNGQSSIEELLVALAPTNRYTFIAPSSQLPNASLEYAKETLDRFAGKLGDEQAKRLKEQRKKRKRGDRDGDEGEVLKIRKIHTQGFEVQQVWEQAKRVIDALKGDAERALEEFGIGGDESEESDEEEGSVDMAKFDEDGFGIGSDAEGEEGDEDVEEMEEEFHTDEEDEMDGQEDGEAFEGFGEEDGEDQDEDEDEDETGVFVEDPNKLNDGFFSIDEFNKQTEFLERQDASADTFTGEASDEEDIDWGNDPMSMPIKADKSSKRAEAMDVSDGEDDKEEGGPTFGNMDLNAPEGDSDDDDEMDLDEAAHLAEDNTNDILYKDFFEPPPRKIGKGELQAKYLERQAKKAKASAPEEDEDAMKRAMADVRRDLFDDEDDANSEDDLSDLDPADPKSRRSTHERRQAKIGEEIRRLEAASVAKRDWTLAGEARALDRPMNSLLEEDLDFERTGKPVPVITAEVSESIEELIKRRILAQEFDEVIRRRPDSLTPANTRRGLFELDDSKNKQSLAEIYEEEHVKNTNPDTFVSKTDEKVQAQEKEVENLWKEVCAKLDALSSWHYKPKPAAPSLTVVGDVATISMEDAQPSTASGIAGGESMLAPQEIYKAGQLAEGQRKDNNEITRGGAPVAREEMSREEKLRRRRREKERIKKMGDGEKVVSKKTKEKREVVGELKKAGVKIIGKRGEIRDVEGRKILASEVVTGGGGFKL
ncbi:putative U3 small nucleolar ribonucleoprotein mpp10 [Sclerotinia borealis F-4128]|uniref:U3 small nucleolar ribonucleoprotein protein MPP10 n=1 Tax=Sclerotinia borealis (strain F-4128) TaxID=1432307 RepID=W9C986_SCLBF|nr:putative U3 small nucleolar ribonucleoprotein mpp10 [Sclerotinia borealis F-4128]